MGFVGRAWVVLLAVAQAAHAAPLQAPGSPQVQETRAEGMADALPPVECVRMLREARNALERGSKAEGLRLLRAAAEAFPHELAPVLELWSRHRADPLPEAEAVELRALLTRRLSDPDSVIPVGMLEYLVQSPDAGEDELRLVLGSATARLAKIPADRDLLNAVAGLQLRLDLKAEARATLGRLLAVEDDDDVRWRALDLDVELERWADAATLLQPLVKRDPVPPLARITYVQALGKLGRHEALARELESLASDEQILRETIVDVLLGAAWDLRDLGHDAQAERWFRKVLEADPEQREARAAVVQLYTPDDERRARQAALDSAWATETDPLRLLERGANLLATGDAERALPLLERAAAGLPDAENAWFNLGLCALRLERWERAAEALARAAAINPQRAEAFFNRGAALSNLERCPEAIADLEHALALQPEMRQAHYYLYVCHRALGNGEAAMREYRLYGSE